MAGTAEDEFSVAAGHYQARRWDLAGEAFEAFGRQFPKHPLAKDAEFYRAEALAQASQFAQAADLLNRLFEDLGAGKRRSRAMFRRGEIAYLARDLLAAKRFLNAFWQEYPDDELLAHVLVYLGDVHAMLDEPAQAEAAYRTCLLRFPDCPLAASCTFGLAQALAAQHQHDKSESLFAGLAASEDEQLVARAIIELAGLAAARRDFVAVKRHCEELVAREGELVPRVRLLYAEALHELKQPDEAEAHYTALSIESSDGPLHRRALYGRLRLAADRRDYAAMDRLGQAFIAAYADDKLACNVHAAMGEALLAEQQYEGAIHSFAAAIESGAEGKIAAQCHAGIAWSQLQQEDLLGSAESIETLIEQYPDNPRAARAGLLRARILEQNGDADAALATYHRVIADMADADTLPQALFLAARIHDRLHQSNEARRLYERVISETPVEADSQYVPQAMYQLGWLLQQAGDWPGAAKQWQALHDLGHVSPHWRAATYLLAEDAVERGDVEHARSLVPLLIDTSDTVAASGREGSRPEDDRANPSGEDDLFARSLLLAAQLAMHDDDWLQARNHLARIVLDCPTDPLCTLAQFWVAEADYRLNEFERAGEEFEQLHAVAAGRDEAWAPFVPLRRAQIMAHGKQWTGAMAVAREVMEQHAKFSLRYEAEYVLGRCHAAKGEFAAARDAYEHVVASETGGRTETAAMAQWMIGESYLHQRDYDAALRAFLRGEVLYPFPEWQARSLLQAGKCYELLDQWDKAEATYRRLIERFPDADAAEDIRSRLNNVTRHVAVRRKGTQVRSSVVHSSLENKGR